jgi:TatD DNase family protein
LVLYIIAVVPSAFFLHDVLRRKTENIFFLLLLWLLSSYNIYSIVEVVEYSRAHCLSSKEVCYAMEFADSVSHCIYHIQESDVETKAEGNTSYLVDFDANLLHKDVDIQSAITTALANNVKGFVVPGSTLQDSSDALELSAGNRHIIAATVGVHPYNTQATLYDDDALRTLEELTASPYCLAVGECGLDYSNGFPEKDYQLPWFKIQIDLAIRLNKPLYLHERLASTDFIAILKEKLYPAGDSCNPQPLVPCVVHCFTSTMDDLREYVRLGLYIGLTGYIMNLSSEVLSEILSIIPLSQLVVETDAPYMGFKGCRKTEVKKRDSKYPNVPACLPVIVTRISEHANIEYTTLVTITTENTYRFFGITP